MSVNGPFAATRVGPLAIVVAIVGAIGQAELAQGGDVETGGGGHWALRPVEDVSVPSADHRTGGASPIDRFVGARLRARGLRPSLPANRATLLRRAYFDLLGIPPTRADILSFVTDPAPDAFERVVDRLLARPEYGERWGRHWLDVARYADTKGYVDAGERYYPFAYTYRDYVIQSFNEDLPYDRFVLEQLAADQLDHGDRGSDPLAALGFLTVGQRFNFFPHEIIDDRIDVTSRGFLGLTVTCARCHDHKFDAVSARDYYALYAVFANSREPPPHELPLLSSARDEPTSAKRAAFEKKLKETGAAYAEKRSQLHRQIQGEMRTWVSDYLDYLVQNMPEHRTRAEPLLRTKRGLLREFSAYGPGGVVRWRRFIEDRGKDDSIFGFWNRVVGLQREEFARRAGQVLDNLVRSDGINPLLAVGLNVLVARSGEELMARAEATPLLVGARGSALELVLSALYFESDPPPPASYADMERIEGTGLALPIPLHVRFRARGRPIVGTTLDYFDFRSLRVAAGRQMAVLGECVVGAGVARALGVGPGDTLVSSPESAFDLAGVYPLELRVAGVLAPAYSPDDSAVFVDVKTAWIIEGLGHGHQDLAKPEAEAAVLAREGDRITANASVVQYNRITEANRDSFHFHGDLAGYPITAVLAVPHDAKARALLMGRFAAPDEHPSR